MNNSVAVVCAAILVIALQSEKCYSLEYTLESSGNLRSSQSNNVVPVLFGSSKTYDIANNEKKLSNHLVFNKLFLNKDEAPEDILSGRNHRRIVRQAYQGQASLYPSLPSGPPYGQQPYPDYNNPSPSYNPQWQNPNNYNQTQSGYPSQTNGYQPNHINSYGTYPISNGYKPSNYTPNNPWSPTGQNSQPNVWQPNQPHNSQGPYHPSNGNYSFHTNNTSSSYPGSQPVNPYNSPSARTPYRQPGLFQNSTQGRYPISQGYKPVNITNNSPIAHSTPNPQTIWRPSNPHNNPQRPFNPSNGSYPFANNGANLYPGTQLNNPFNNPNSRPPYQQPGQFQNSSYPGYQPYTPARPVNTPNTGYSYNPNQQPRYNPGQSPPNNTYYPRFPTNQHSVIYDNSTLRPGQSLRNTYNNVSNFNTLNNTQAPPYNYPNGQNPLLYNSYPGTPGNINQTPYQNSTFGQHSSNNYPGYSPDSATFNLANKFNPIIQNNPSYGNASPYGTAPYGNGPPLNHFQYPNVTQNDPTKVSPHSFNSY